jgi:O-methyltransferase
MIFTNMLPEFVKAPLRKIPQARSLSAKIRIVRSALAGEMEGYKIRFQEDGLATVHNCDFLQDPRFQRAFAAGAATGSWYGSSIRWRAYTVCWAAERALSLPGDFVECGVNKGGLARMILEYVDFDGSGKSFFLFDTFKGMPKSHLADGERTGDHFNYYTECLDEVKRTFSPFRSINIVPGIVPESLTGQTIEQIAFLSLDMNCVMPEIAAAEHFWPKLVSGAVIVLDDYGWDDLHLLQKQAFDEFARSKGVSVFLLPTGQGLIFKP